MKKMFVALGVVLASLMACSESDSGGSTQPCIDASCTSQQQTSKNNASKCDLATQKLPASSLAWQPTFAGGCEVVQQFPLADSPTLQNSFPGILMRQQEPCPKTKFRSWLSWKLVPHFYQQDTFTLISTPALELLRLFQRNGLEIM